MFRRAGLATSRAGSAPSSRHAGAVTGLPEGWDLQRIRTLEPSALLLDVASHTIFVGDGQDYEELPRPTCIISFSGLCLVRVEGDDDWWMGQLDDADGSIVCWSPYGRDLEEAIRAL